MDNANSPKTDLTIQWMHDSLWALIFIPSLMQALYTFFNPFIEFKQDSDDFLIIIQHIFDISFPHIQYTVKSDDNLVGKVNTTCHLSVSYAWILDIYFL